MTRNGDAIHASAREADSSELTTEQVYLGVWFRPGDPGYREALREQQELEESWEEIREVLGDG